MVWPRVYPTQETCFSSARVFFDIESCYLVLKTDFFWDFMLNISKIGSLLKRTYRIYSNNCLKRLEAKGFSDLRPSFLEILFYICENPGSSIKDIGIGCGLKKQTMTSHLNELVKRGYISRKINDHDKREQNIFLTEYGEKFKFSLMESISEIEMEFSSQVGSVELERVEHHLKNFHDKIYKKDSSLIL